MPDQPTDAETIAELQRQLIFWRAQALRGWAEEVGSGGGVGPGGRAEIEEAHRIAGEALAELDAMRRSTSWRVTKPLRAVSTRVRAVRGG